MGQSNEDDEPALAGYGMLTGIEELLEIGGSAALALGQLVAPRFPATRHARTRPRARPTLV